MSFLKGWFRSRRRKTLTSDASIRLDDAVAAVFLHAYRCLSRDSSEIPAEHLASDVKSAFIHYLFGVVQAIEQDVSDTYLVEGWCSSQTSRIMEVFLGHSNAEAALLEIGRLRGIVPNNYSVFNILGGEAFRNLMDAYTAGISESDWREGRIDTFVPALRLFTNYR